MTTPTIPSRSSHCLQPLFWRQFFQRNLWLLAFLLPQLPAGAQWSTATLSQARYNTSATAAGNKTFFGGGYGSSGRSNVVDIYDNGTNTWSTATLSQARFQFTAAAVGSKVFFAGGNGPSGASDVVDIYDNSTNAWSTATLSQARVDAAAASVDNKVFFGGGHSASGPSDVVDIYDNSTNTWSTATLSKARYILSAAAVGNKVFFAGGHDDNYLQSNVVDIYDNSSNTWSTATLSQARHNLSATAMGNKVFFAGGAASGALSNVVDIYDNSTNTWSTATLSQARTVLSATAMGNKVFFAGGAASGAVSNVVDIYDNSTNIWSTATLSQGRYSLSATAVGNKVFFAGGQSASGYSNVVDIFTAGPTAPTNDECANALSLMMNAAPLTGTGQGATQSLPAITCGGFTGNALQDVWYNFTTTSAGQYKVTVVGSSGYDAVINLRSGACNGTNIGCADATGTGGTEALTATLAGSTTYSVRVYHYAGTSTASFTIKAEQLVSAPTVSGFTPGSACPGTQQPVVITGTGFTNVTGISFGGTAAVSYTVNSPTQITAVAAVGSTGAVSVSTTVGTGSSAAHFILNTAPTASVNVIPSNATYTGADPDSVIYIGYGPQSATLQTTASGGTSLSYAWAGLNGSPTAPLSNPGGASPTFLTSTPGLYEYQLTVSNSTGCTATVPVTMCVRDVRVPQAASIRTAPKVYVCVGGQTQQVLQTQVASNLSASGNYLGQCGPQCLQPVLIPLRMAAGGAMDAEGGVSEAVATRAMSAVVFPNPSTSAFTLRIESAASEAVDVRVLDLSGREVERLPVAETGSEVTLGSRLSPGVYFVEVRSGDAKATIRVVKL